MSFYKGIAVVLGLMLSSSAWSQAADETMGTERRATMKGAGDTLVGARLGMSDVDDLGDPVLTFGAFGDYVMDENITVGATLDYWDKSGGTVTEVGADVSDLSLGANAKYIFTGQQVTFQPYALAGASFHQFSKEVTTRAADGTTETDRDRTGRFGIDFGGGALYTMQTDVDLVGEIRYRAITATTDDFDHVAFMGGLSYRM